ncbi:sulfate ABC transporter, sulfate-binding protein [Verrucomicrobiia bacterium DG1235]|nr:sulfate ABC transporter, sulfate-binding protein [Verrucomicrobiae bacterium DG1235]
MIPIWNIGDISKSSSLSRAHALAALFLIVGILLTLILVHYLAPSRPPNTLLHVSYDASRELFENLNQAYTNTQAADSAIKIHMSHAGSIRQARNLTKGLKADVVSLASIHDAKLIDGFPLIAKQPATFHSSVAFIVRQGNPKMIHDWGDVFREDVRLAIPSPSESGIGRWAFLSLYSYLHTKHSGNEKAIAADLSQLMSNTEIINNGSRTALALFKTHSSADLFLTWESEVLRTSKDANETLQAIYPAESVQIDIYIAPRNAASRSVATQEYIDSYLLFLSSQPAQEIAARFGFRPSDPSITLPETFPKTQLYKIEDRFPDPDLLWQSLFEDEGSLEKALWLTASQRLVP